MPRKCNLSSQQTRFGKHRSHSQKATRRTFKPNLQNVSVYVPELGCKVRIRVSARDLRTIDKVGLKQFLEKQGRSLNSVRNF